MINKKTLEALEEIIKDYNRNISAAYHAVSILKSLKSEDEKLDDETRQYLQELLNQYGDDYFFIKKNRK